MTCRIPAADLACTSRARLAGLIASRLLRHFAARSPGLKAVGDRAAAARPLGWVTRRFPAQVAWGRRRLDVRSPQGFWLTFTVAAGALAAWAFGGLTQDVAGHDDTVLADPHVTAWCGARLLDRAGSIGVTWPFCRPASSPVIFSVTYLLTRCLLSCLMLLARRDVSKEAELLVLRHENAVLRRQADRV